MLFCTVVNMRKRQSEVKEKFINRFGLEDFNKMNSWTILFKEFFLISNMDRRFMFNALNNMYSLDDNDEDCLKEEVVNSKEYNFLICSIHNYFYGEYFYEDCQCDFEVSVSYNVSGVCYVAKIKKSNMIVYGIRYEAIIMHERKIIVIEITY